MGSSVPSGRTIADVVGAPGRHSSPTRSSRCSPRRGTTSPSRGTNPSDRRTSSGDAGRVRHGGHGMKHDLGTATRGPTHGLRVSPTLVTDDDTEGQRTGGEDSTIRSRRGIGGLFRNIELDLVLPTIDGPAGTDHTRRDLEPAVGDTFGPKNDGDLGLTRRRGHVVPRLLQEPRVRRWKGMARPSIPRNETLREADDTPRPDGPLRQSRTSPCPPNAAVTRECEEWRGRHVRWSR